MLANRGSRLGEATKSLDGVWQDDRGSAIGLHCRSRLVACQAFYAQEEPASAMIGLHLNDAFELMERVVAFAILRKCSSELEGSVRVSWIRCYELAVDLDCITQLAKLVVRPSEVHFEPSKRGSEAGGVFEGRDRSGGIVQVEADATECEVTDWVGAIHVTGSGERGSCGFELS